MKKTMFLLTAVAASAMLYSGCAKPEISDGNQAGNLVTVYFGTENVDPSTKATLTPNEGETAFQAAWKNEDKIAIKYTYVAANIPDIVQGTWDASTSKFSAELNDLTTGDEVLEMKYQASYPYSADGYVDFGSARTQTGAAYNSIYDLMVAEPVTVTAKPGLDESGNAIVFPMQRQTAIAYFHFTSDNTEAITKATLKVEGEGAAIAAETVLLDPTGMDYETGLSEIVLTTTGQTADDFTLWFNVLPTTFTKMTLTVETETKTFEISNSKGGSYVAGKLYKVKKENIAWTKTPSTVFFYESFDQTTGTGGNDGEWSGSIASNTIKYDNTGWSVENSKGANKCIKVGSSSLGKATTPALNISSSDVKLWFKGAAWNGTSEKTTINVSISGNGTIAPTEITLVKGAWTEYYCTISGADADTKVVFSATQASNNRFFLDEIYVYSGPNPLNSISVISNEGGTITPSHSSAKEGTEITLTATPNAGYKFNDDWVVKDADGASIDVTDNKFTMPASDVTVSGSFSKIDYSITKTASDRGSFVAKKGDAEVETAQIGDEITLVATPKEGYELKSWTVVDSEDNAITVTDNKFTMPASNVTVTATFNSTASYTVSFSVNGTVTTKSYKETETIEFPDVPAQDGVKFMGWTTSDISGIVSSKPVLVDVKSAVMGTNNISYYAVFAAVETAVFDPTDLSATPEQSSTSWKHTATGVTLKLSAGQRYTSGTPNTFTVTNGIKNYFQISSDNNYIISEIETTLSETKYKINSVSSGATLSTSGTTQIVKSDNLTSIKCSATSSNQIRATKITVTVITGYSTKIISLNAVAVSGTPAKTAYTVDEAFDPTGLIVTGTYSNGESAQISDGISWTFTPSTFEASGNQTVSVTATVKSISAAYNVNVTVKTIANTLAATDKSINVNTNLDVKSLFTTNSNADITYTLVENQSGAGTLIGTFFTASKAGTYKVKAAQAVTTKYSAAEATATITVNTIQLSAPANLNCSEKTETSLTFTWDEVTNASGYQVSLDGNTYGATQQETSYIIEGLEPGTSQTLYVKAIGNKTAYTDSKAVSATATTKSAGEVTFSPSYFTGNGASGTGGEMTSSIDNVTIYSDKGYIDGTDHIRIYKGGIITISSTSGTIVKIELTSTASGTSKYGPSKLSLSAEQPGSSSNSGYVTTWTGSANSVEFTATEQYRFNKIIVTCK